MSLLTKLSKTGVKFLTKGVKKVGGDSKAIKTTAQTIGSKLPSIAGGKSFIKGTGKALASVSSTSKKFFGSAIASNVKKGVSTTAKFGIPVAAGLFSLDKFRDVMAQDENIRKAQALSDVRRQDAETSSMLADAAGTLSNAYGEGREFASSNLPTFISDPYSDDSVQQEKDSARSYKLSMVALGAAGLVGGLYYFNKKKKK